ncbi:hypothetical protein BJX61DRAFT_102936 [Aspergillus egyptiacus]|nr:hypothetical protein BJX61DRAFT_102936 [Aspergillus egyptiacus]
MAAATAETVAIPVTNELVKNKADITNSELAVEANGVMPVEGVKDTTLPQFRPNDTEVETEKIADAATLETDKLATKEAEASVTELAPVAPVVAGTAAVSELAEKQSAPEPTDQPEAPTKSEPTDIPAAAPGTEE